MVMGTSFDWSTSLPSSGSDGTVSYVHWMNGAILVALLNGPFAVKTGMLLMPPAGPDPGAYYCVGSTSSSGTTRHFGNFVRLGTAAEGAAAGDLDACYTQ